MCRSVRACLGSHREANKTGAHDGKAGTHRRTPQNGGCLKRKSRGAPHPSRRVRERSFPNSEGRIENGKAERGKEVKNAILIDKIEKIDETETIILRYLIRVLPYNSADGGKRIDYAHTARFLEMSYSRFSKAVERLKERGIVVQKGEKLYLGSMIVEAVATK